VSGELLVVSGAGTTDSIGASPPKDLFSIDCLHPTTHHSRLATHHLLWTSTLPVAEDKGCLSKQVNNHRLAGLPLKAARESVDRAP